MQRAFLSKICKDVGIELCALNRADKHLKIHGNVNRGFGYAVVSKDFKCIVFDNDVDPWEQRYIVSHELGHLLLGHLNGGEVKREDREVEANIFAAVLMAIQMYEDYREETTA